MHRAPGVFDYHSPDEVSWYFRKYYFKLNRRMTIGFADTNSEGNGSGSHATVVCYATPMYRVDKT